MTRSTALTAAALSAVAATAAFAAGQSAPAGALKGVAMKVTGIERASVVSLNDCPPGANNQRGVARAGEEFAVVSLQLTLQPDFKPTMFPRAQVFDADGKAYNTAVQFVDVGKVPDATCAIPFRVPAGTKLKTLKVDTLSLDLSTVAEKN